MRILPMVGFILVLAAPAAAASDNDVVLATQFKLLGRWAADCKRPPGPENPYEFFGVAGGGKVIRTLTMNVPNLDGDTVLSEFQRMGPDLLRAKWVRGADDATTVVTMKIANGERRSWISADESGEVLIEAGTFVSSGRPTPVFHWCSAN